MTIELIAAVVFFLNPRSSWKHANDSMFDLDSLRSRCQLAQLDFHDQLGSTNDRAKELAKTNRLQSPALILTSCQTAGRGQRERRWWSGEGSLTFTWCFQSDPQTSSNQCPRLPIGMVPLATAWAVCRSIETLAAGMSVQIKWPNDILVNSKKVAGMLVESVPTNSASVVVIGVGINVNQEPPAHVSITDLPVDAIASDSGIATTSLADEWGEKFNLNELLILIVNWLNESLLLGNLGSEALVRFCNEKLAYENHKISLFQANDNITVGTVKEISTSGGLVLSTETGCETFFSGSIRPL